MSLNAIDPIPATIQVTPLLATMLAHNDQRPKNNLPTDTQGTIQENAKPMPEVTLYTDLVSRKP